METVFIAERSPAAGKLIRELALRTKTGASVVALLQGEHCSFSSIRGFESVLDSEKDCGGNSRGQQYQNDATDGNKPYRG